MHTCMGGMLARALLERAEGLEERGVLRVHGAAAAEDLERAWHPLALLGLEGRPAVEELREAARAVGGGGGGGEGRALLEGPPRRRVVGDRDLEVRELEPHLQGAVGRVRGAGGGRKG